MSERGSVTFWVLGLAMCILTVGVLAADLWNLMAHRRELAVIADSAALAAASAIDEAAWRTEGEVMIDRVLAEARAAAVVRAHIEVATSVELSPGWVVVDAGRRVVRITLRETVPSLFLGLAGEDAVSIAATSEAAPVRH